jgi:hypothetical protein
LTSPEPCEIEISHETTGDLGPSAVHQVGYTKIRSVAMAQRDVAMAQRDAIIESAIWKLFHPYGVFKRFFTHKAR